MDYKISGERLTSIANAIRGKTGKEDSLTLEQMVTEIEGIEAGGGKAGFESILTDRIANNIVSTFEGFMPGGILEDTTPPATLSGAKCYYNDVLLPGIPAEMLKKYPYVWIRADNDGGNYNLVLAEQPWYFNDGMKFNGISSDDFPALGCIYYSIPISKAANATEWEFTKSGFFSKFSISETRTVMWSNHDIPNGSADATEIYFEGSQPVLA